MPFRQLSPFSRFLGQLRVRLTIWNTLVVLLAVIAALVGVREGLRYSLEYETDRVLGDAAQELVLAIGAFYPDTGAIVDEMKRKAESHHDRGWHVRWLSGDRATLYASELAPPAPLPTLVRRLDDGTVWATSDFRSFEREVNLPNIPKYYVRVGTDTAFIRKDVEQVTRILAPVGLAIFLLAPLGGYLMAERAVDPLQKIIRTTERLRPQNMDERLPLRGVGDELDQLAHRINMFLDQIAAHLQQNQEFLANAAHELRSPLAAIQSLVEVTLDKPRSQEEYEELLYSIHNECQHLGQLVNQLMTLAENDARGKELKAEPFSLSEMIGNAVDMFGAVAEEKGVRLKTDLAGEGEVVGERKQIRQVVSNLIDNAIKFTPPEGEVTVSLRRVTRGRETLVQLQVHDTGVGISAADLPRIFDRFYQADRSRSRQDDRGSGLGLSICRAIVARHRGEISVESRLGDGTTFTVLLPG